MKALMDATINSANEAVDSLGVVVSILEQTTMDSPDRESRAKARACMIIISRVIEELQSIGGIYKQVIG